MISTFPRKYLLLIFITSFTLILDQITKWVVHHQFRLGESIPVLGSFFNLTYVRNTGAAFGIMAQADPAFRIPFFIIVPLLALGAIGSLFYKLPNRDLRTATALSLVVGGAIGNLIDRVYYGFVIDFLDFHWNYQYHFPAFNVADSAICVGVGLLMLDIFNSPEGKNGAKGDKKNASHSI